jgi:hypothetical protein
MRYVPPSRRYLSADLVYGGPGEGAFELRDEDEGAISVTEVEYYGECNQEGRAIAAAGFRESIPSKTLSKNAIFSWAEVQSIKDGALLFKKNVRVVRDPVEGNLGHAQIRHFTGVDLEILEYFAENVFSEYSVVSDMNIPDK